jgi:hypothetical protein
VFGHLCSVAGHLHMCIHLQRGQQKWQDLTADCDVHGVPHTDTCTACLGTSTAWLGTSTAWATKVAGLKVRAAAKAVGGRGAQLEQAAAPHRAQHRMQLAVHYKLLLHKQVHFVIFWFSLPARCLQACRACVCVLQIQSYSHVKNRPMLSQAG